MVSSYLLQSWEFRVLFLLDWLLLKARDPCVPCYVMHSWSGEVISSIMWRQQTRPELEFGFSDFIFRVVNPYGTWKSKIIVTTRNIYNSLSGVVEMKVMVLPSTKCNLCLIVPINHIVCVHPDLVHVCFLSKLQLFWNHVVLNSWKCI